MTVFSVSGWMPTISISSPTVIFPCSMRPVTTVPRPVMVKTSSIGIRKGFVDVADGLGDVRVDRGHQLGRIFGVHSGSPSSALSAETWTGMSSPSGTRTS